MASIIPGYEYDIFISYRQKDNKGDRWVSEFVDALKTELESTFKEEISVYFDINPHDGLLETHDVDASLKEKLKCLVFIPIISRTYCDPKSFAWEHEFKAFVDSASHNQFGLKVKLPNGNVANRVLPVIIHDLDIADIKECEIVLGGVLRGVEFIYAEAGVNRPLKPDDDEKINLNKTKYRNQINKIANAIKEIITAIKQYSPLKEEAQKEVFKPISAPRENRKTKIITASVIALALIVLGYFLIPTLSKPKEQLEKSIAVLPFLYRGNDASQLWISEEFEEEIRSNLLEVKSFTVRPRSSSDRFGNTKRSAIEIGNDLKANYLVEGSVAVDGNNMKMLVYLIDSKADKTIWTKEYPGELIQILPLQSEVANQIVSELKIELSPEEKKRFEQSPTKNPEAYNLYLQGRFFWNKRTKEGLKKSIEYFEKAIALDRNYALAIAGLADAYNVQAFWGWSPPEEGYARAKELAKKSIEIDYKLAEAHATLGNILCYGEWKWEEARKELILAIELNPNYATAHQYYSELLDIIGQNEEARMQINQALDLEPYNMLLHLISSQYYYHEGKSNKSLEECFKMQELDPQYIFAYLWSFNNYVRQSDGIKAIDILQKIISLDTLTAKKVYVVRDVYNKAGMKGLINSLIELKHKMSPHIFYVADSTFYLAKWYAMLDRKEEAINWLEKGIQYHSKIAQVNNDPDFDNLRSDPRFQKLIKRIGLSEFQKRK